MDVGQRKTEARLLLHSNIASKNVRAFFPYFFDILGWLLAVSLNPYIFKIFVLAPTTLSCRYDHQPIVYHHSRPCHCVSCVRV